MSDAVRQTVLAQYAAHKSWSVQLHHDNLVALAETRPDLESGAVLRDAAPLHEGERPRQAAARHVAPDRTAPSAPRRASFDREVRSYEAEYVNGLWHWDCHHGSRKVLTARGEWLTPILFGVLDDRSRLACHLQWYLAETRRDHRPWPGAGVPEARPAARGAERQRRRHDGRRDHRRASPASASCTRPRCPTAPTRTPSRRPSGARSRAG